MQSFGEEYIERREEGQDSIPTSIQWKKKDREETRKTFGMV